MYQSLYIDSLKTRQYNPVQGDTYKPRLLSDYQECLNYLDLNLFISVKTHFLGEFLILFK